MSSRVKFVLGAVALLGVIGIFAATQSVFVQNFLFAMTYERTLDTYSQVDTTPDDVTNTVGPDGRPASLLSAFYGLDDALPGIVNLVACEGAGGQDGMPVIFSHQVDVRTVEPGDFKVTTSSDSVSEVTCLTLAPADDPGELRTALLTGPLGRVEDQPATVEIIGNLLSLDNSLNFKGASVKVTALEEGPSLVWAETVPKEEWRLGSQGTRFRFGGGTGCPAETAQVIRVTWGGGVTKPSGQDADELERDLYKVTVRRSDGTEDEIAPLALADLGDGDNNHKLCLDMSDPAKSVSFPAGHLTDPRDDLNPSTSISILN